jgi:hypothetical protein
VSFLFTLRLSSPFPVRIRHRAHRWCAVQARRSHCSSLNFAGTQCGSRCRFALQSARLTPLAPRSPSNTTHHAPCTTHHAPRTFPHAPRSLHHAPCTVSRCPAPRMVCHAPLAYNTVRWAPCIMHHAPLPYDIWRRRCALCQCIVHFRHPPPPRCGHSSSWVPLVRCTCVDDPYDAAPR